MNFRGTWSQAEGKATSTNPRILEGGGEKNGCLKKSKQKIRYIYNASVLHLHVEKKDHCISIAGVVDPQTHVKGLQNRHDQRVPGVAWGKTECSTG